MSDVLASMTGLLVFAAATGAILMATLMLYHDE